MIPLHIHSFYSMLSGTPSVEALIEKAKSYKLKSLVLTDTNGMYGLIKFAKAAGENGIKPILGVYIDDPDETETYALLLAKNFSGYSDICRIITSRKLKDDFSLAGLLQTYYPDLFIITPSIKLLEQIPNRENIFAELISTPDTKRHTRELYKFARAKNIRLVASNPIYFLDREDFVLHKVVSAVKNRTTMGRLKAEEIKDDEFYFKDPESERKKWAKLPEVLDNIDFIEENCNVDLRLGKLRFPVYPDLGLHTSESFLSQISYAGLRSRYGEPNEIEIARLERELGVIEDLRLSDYFLVVWDIYREAKRRGMMTLGRGSAANSIVSYVLGFTDIDPIEQNLYFERFLNKSRSSPPDIDIDFSWRERDEIVKYVFDKYGYSRVAMISTHVTMRARSAFRETAKVFGFSEAEISKISKFIPWTSAKNLPHLSELFPEARSLKLNVSPWKEIVDIASKLGSVPRHLSIHPSGIVVAPDSIVNYTALEFAKNKGVGLIITQPDMYGIEDLGLIKIDLLSQRSLGVLRDTLRDLKEGESGKANPKIFSLNEKVARIY